MEPARGIETVTTAYCDTQANAPREAGAERHVVALAALPIDPDQITAAGISTDKAYHPKFAANVASIGRWRHSSRNHHGIADPKRSGYITGYNSESPNEQVSSQRRAIDNYRSRLTERGMARFEVIGPDDDRELIRSVAKRLAEGGADADRLRAAVSHSFSGQPPKKGGILKRCRARLRRLGTRPDPSA